MKENWSSLYIETYELIILNLNQVLNQMPIEQTRYKMSLYFHKKVEKLIRLNIDRQTNNFKSHDKLLVNSSLIADSHKE